MIINGQTQIPSLIPPASCPETREEINLILDHSLKNYLCAFGLQGQVLQSILDEGVSEDNLLRLARISERSQGQVERMGKTIERLRWLIQLEWQLNETKNP